MSQMICESTRRNWSRLDVVESSRLTKRANKRLSSRKIVPVEYFANTENLQAVSDILSVMEDGRYSIEDVLCSVAENLFRNKGILNKNNVHAVLSEYAYTRIDDIVYSDIPQDERDLLGIIYQSSMTEGIKNQKGAYYTPGKVTASMVAGLSFEQGQTFFDPCCGSGAFLLALPCDNPDQIYGIDNDPIAVMIAKFNLLLRYSEREFIPQVICSNFLLENAFSKYAFDYVVTNPPWGAFCGETEEITEITSLETFSLFFVKSYRQIKENGIVRFLLPEAVLNVKAHKDIRTFILENCCLNSITIYDGSFSGVVTGYVDIACQKRAASSVTHIYKDGSSFEMDTSVFVEHENRVFCFFDSMDTGIVNQCKCAGQYSLEDSIWALGIVTGDNRGKLKAAPADGLEAIYTGKEIIPYGLKAARNYVLYDRSSFQQVAKEEYYRAEEKLVYKFISNKLVFAYDDRQRLFLNSANILIPRVPGMSIKTVLALLNSELFSYLYQKLFGEVKILKGNLIQLPFPAISPEQDCRISAFVEDILAGCFDHMERLQEEVYSLFDLSHEQIQHIRRVLHGKTD